MTKLLLKTAVKTVLDHKLSFRVIEDVCRPNSSCSLVCRLHYGEKLSLSRVCFVFAAWSRHCADAWDSFFFYDERLDVTCCRKRHEYVIRP